MASMTGAGATDKKSWQCLKLPALWAKEKVCGCSGRFFSFLTGILRQGRDILGYHCPLVDADVVNQAGPEGPLFHSRAGADVQAVF